MIVAYLEQLADALRFDPALSARVLPEVRDHLEEALAAEHVGERDEAEQCVLARFGDPHELAAQFASISLTRHIRCAGFALLVATVVLMVLMKMRVFWYAFVHWTLLQEVRPMAQIVIAVDRFTFWLGVTIGVAAVLFIARYPTPVRAHPGYRRHLRHAALLCGLSTVLLGASVTSDFILVALQFRNDVTALVPILSIAAEIVSVGVIAFLIVKAARRLTRAESSL